MDKNDLIFSDYWKYLFQMYYRKDFINGELLFIGRFGLIY